MQSHTDYAITVHFEDVRMVVATVFSFDEGTTYFLRG